MNAKRCAVDELNTDQHSRDATTPPLTGSASSRTVRAVGDHGRGAEQHRTCLGVHRRPCVTHFAAVAGA